MVYATDRARRSETDGRDVILRGVAGVRAHHEPATTSGQWARGCQRDEIHSPRLTAQLYEPDSREQPGQLTASFRRPSGEQAQNSSIIFAAALTASAIFRICSTEADDCDPLRAATSRPGVPRGRALSTR